MAGLQSGYSGKRLVPVPVRSLGRISLSPLLQTLGLRIAVLEDREALARVRVVSASRGGGGRSGMTQTRRLGQHRAENSGDSHLPKTHKLGHVDIFCDEIWLLLGPYTGELIRSDSKFVLEG